MRRLLRFSLWMALLLGIVVGIARGAAIRWWTVPDQDPYLEASVAPTLRGGDVIVLWRLTKPTFGDLVLCPEPDAPERVVIGRIVGEAGDKITIKDGNVSINGKAGHTERACTEREYVIRDPNVGTEVKQFCQIENLSGHLHMRGSTSGHEMAPAEVTTEVEAGRVFLLSDNRLYPYDSRDYGTVERASCKESVVFRIVGKNGFSDTASRFAFVR